MEPTLHCAGRPPCGRRFNRNRVQTVESSKGPQRFDIVVAHAPATSHGCYEYPLRVIGLPGEAWEERRGRVYINGKLLPEPFIRRGRRDSRTLSMADITPKGKLSRIPADKYLLMGDNRSVACDSRVWGLVDRKTDDIRTVIVIADYTGRPTGRPPRGY